MSLLGLLLPYILSIVGSKFCTQRGNSVVDPQQVTEKIEDVYVYICVCRRLCIRCVQLKMFTCNVAPYSV
jgi:hypothetical protein